MSGAESSSSASSRPVLIYDGDCRFCRMWIERWREATGESVEYLAQQEHACGQRFPGLDPGALQEAVHRVEPDGRITRGAEAVFRTLAQVAGWGWLARFFLRHRMFLGLAESAYRVVSRNRQIFSWVTRALWGDSVSRPEWRVARELFLAGLAVVHLIALGSLWGQIDGLIGSQGILPASDFMRDVAMQLDRAGVGWGRYRMLPTLGWLGAGDGVLHGFCAVGVVLALLALAGVARAPAFLGLWVIYLSLSLLGQDFLSFQWDTLLVEATLLAVFVAPWRLGRAAAGAIPPSRLARGLVVWLLFRLMLESGVVKLASGDPAWRGWSALEFHFWTQPLPGPAAWHANQLPAWVLRIACGVMFGVELLLPWLMWGPRRLRLAAFFGLAGLQVLIFATGNYTFFNLLALLLCLVLVDDATWGRWLRRPGVGKSLARPGTPAWSERVRGGFLAGLAAVSVWVGAGPIVGLVSPDLERRMGGLTDWLAPLRSFNAYGLFAVMTTTRPEIVVEGSADGVTWRAYEFRYKPGPVDRRPEQVAPHQPRLDWQMWFAALGDVRQNPWFIRFGLRLIEGSRPVLALLRDNPFPDAPPKYIRARLFQYRFSTRDERRSTGAWWVREERGLYCPAFASRQERPGPIQE